MRVRFAAAGTAKVPVRISGEAVLRRIQRVLAGEQEQRIEPTGAQCIRDGCELDGFGAGADCNRDWSGQPSP
jgi:hypothetical protein